MAKRKSAKTKRKSAKTQKPKKRKQAPRPQERILFLRTCKAKGKSHGNFQWPLTVGAEVEALDWDPEPVCGGGLHGLMWGEGDSSLLTYDALVWLVFSTDPQDVIEIDQDKAKVRKARVEFVGTRETAPTWLATRAPGHAVHFARRAVGDNKTVVVGDYGNATAGYSGQATAGRYGRATAGNNGQATAGDGDQATAGDEGHATAGYKGHATVGYWGIISIKHWDEKAQRYRLVTGYIGEDGLEPGVVYRLNDEGKFARA